MHLGDTMSLVSFLITVLHADFRPFWLYHRYTLMRVYQCHPNSHSILSTSTLAGITYNGTQSPVASSIPSGPKPPKHIPDSLDHKWPLRTEQVWPLRQE